MWFLVTILSFLVGMLTLFQSYLVLLYILPELRKLNHNYDAFKRRYYGNIFINIILIVVVIILLCTALKQYVIEVIIGYFVIPFFISLSQKEKTQKEFIENKTYFEISNLL